MGSVDSMRLEAIMNVIAIQRCFGPMITLALHHHAISVFPL